jgi:hypothetical protein
MAIPRKDPISERGGRIPEKDTDSDWRKIHFVVQCTYISVELTSALPFFVPNH